MIQEQNKLYRRVVLSIDLLLLTASLLAAYYAREVIYDLYPVISTFELLPLAPLYYYIGLLPILLIIWGGLLYYFGIYKSFHMKVASSLLIILKTAIIGFVIFGSYVFILKMQEQVSRLVILLTFLFATTLISLDKIALLFIFRYLGERDESFKSSLMIFRRILVVGSGPRARKFIKLIKRNPDWGITIIGLIDNDSNLNGEIVEGYEVLGSFEDVPAIVHNNIIDEVVFVVPRSWLNNIEELILFCESEGIKVNLAVDLYNLKISKAKHINFHGIPFIAFESTPDKLGHLFIKRLVDFVVSGIALIVLSFFFLIITIIIKIDERNCPVFYKQVRCGLNGRKFTLHKFRSMVVDAESKQEDLMIFNEMNGPVFKMKNDPRITNVGKWLRKFSLDELPQLWNVLRGDMSLVGPRPPLPSEVEKYTPEQRRRLSMRPGLTCLWQIIGRSKISDFEEWTRLDFEYIDNWSHKLDFKILIKSVPVVLFGKGAR